MQHLEGLNPAQKKAALHTEGPLLIVAGAGAGKTKTIVHRIMNLVKMGTDPRQILAITFTNKAAREMRERVTALLKKEGMRYTDYEQPTVKTFHALGVEILKEESRALGLPRRFAILDDGESTALVREAVNEAGLDVKQWEPRRLRHLISRQKGDFVRLEDFMAGAEGHFPKTLAFIWRRYEEKLREAKALDFDDLIVRTVRHLQDDKEARERWRARWRYLHVDEYQDTNGAQYELTQLLVGAAKNICVVGDSDQNIYGWRGANMKNILNFEKDYPGAMVVLLEENYRSTQNIIAAANEIIKKTKNPEGEKIGMYEAFDETDEAQFVAGKIKKLNENGIPYDRVAVLYRANFQSRAFEEALFGASVPYQVLGTKFFERKEVKDVLAYIRYALDQGSLADLKRIVNVPARGIGKVALLKLGTQEKIKEWRLVVAALADFAGNHPPSALVKEVAKRSGLERILKDGTEEDQERLENIRELAAMASRYDTLPLEEGLEQFLEDAALFSDQDDLKEKEGGAKLMTVHAAKGLEFSHVFVTGLEQDLFPHARMGEPKKEKEAEEEERRLFYVALTRAEKKLYLSYTMMRTVYGGKQVNTPSEFIFDISPELLEKEEREETGRKVIYLD
ncbi:UvrD-helicase domain-containing protein [Candidatus Parcubacteria bacterium]|nr:UvrD-helicase domain-containing protein [Candidatus Parcubacteria bacterium]